MILKPLTEYSDDELSQAQQISPAIQRYLQVLKNKKCPQLYRLRHTAWLESALAQIFETSSTEDICKYWSLKTDEIIQYLWKKLSTRKQSHLSFFALGKWGAQELNLSSDIDVLVVSESPPSEEDYKFIRQFNKLLTEHSEFGFCYRVDYDLRPGGRLSSLIVSCHQLEDYYWSQGSTWEKIALIRLRAICGNQNVHDKVQKTAQRFSYRKFLDFRVIDKIGQVRQMIHTQKEILPPDKISLKFNKGAIRDIEFYINSLQVIHGGKITALQTHSTSKAIDQLKECELIPIKELELLKNTYWTLRSYENITQIINDQQTHLWPHQGPTSFLPEKTQYIVSLCKETQQLIETRIKEPDEEIEILPSLDKQADWLRSLGFSNHSIEKTWSRLINTHIHSHIPSEDQQKFHKFIMNSVIEIYKFSGDKDLGLSLLADFISSIRAKSSFFSLLLRNEKLLKNIITLFSTSPYLGGIIASRPELLDSFILQASESSGSLDIYENLVEKKLLSEIINANRFLIDKDVLYFTSSLSLTADQICLSILDHLHDEYGKSQVKILALGKWGGQELGLKSDLDFVFVTENEPQEIDYKIAKRFISRLKDQHRGGNIYNVDLRLRPSGKIGPLISSESQLKKYLNHQAQPWERQSYTKARWIEKSNFFSYSPINQGLSSAEQNELNTIRSKLLKKSSQDMQLDLKYNPGGLIDIEFCAQIYLLANNIQPKGPSLRDHLFSLLKTSEAPELWKELSLNYQKLRSFEQFYQITSSLSGARIDFNSAQGERLSKIFNRKPQQLFLDYKEMILRNIELIQKLNPILKRQPII